MTAFYKMDKTDHPLAGTLICKNNFFNNPDKILALAGQQVYTRSDRFPGQRTINLLESTDTKTRDFAVFFAKKLAREVFPGISRFVTHISFHINDSFDSSIANAGWIHNDDVRLAGLVYLNQDVTDFESGTSIFLKQGKQDFETSDFPSRKEFNLTQVPDDQYLKDLKNNHSNFQETIKVGNVYNRLIAYDSNLWHRPNSFKVSSSSPRTTLLFFIDFYEYAEPDVDNLSKWVD